MSMLWLIYFLAAPFLATQAAGNNCGKEKARQLVELMIETRQKEPLFESVQLGHHAYSIGEQKLVDSVESLLNQGINDSETYYKTVHHDAVTCTLGKQSTTIVTLEMREADCDKIQALTDEEERENCLHKRNGKTIECVWSGEPSWHPLTYGFWCAEATRESFRYPDNMCRAWRYKETTAYRLPVPEKYRPWSMPMLAYEPPECSWHPRYGTDCIKHTPEEITSLRERPQQKSLHRDGRTGLRGRGMYRKSGGNTFHQTLVLRNLGGGNKQLLVEKAALRAGLLVLPMFPAGGMPLWDLFGGAIRKQMELGVNNCTKSAMNDLFKASKKLYEGDMWDARNTDDAWLNLYSFALKDEAFIDTIKHGADSRFTWLFINETTEAYLKNVLQKVYTEEIAEKLSEPTVSIKEKLVLLKKLGVVRTTIDATNCAASLYPLVPMGLPVSDFLGILTLAVFFF